MASCSSTGMATSRISTDSTVMPHSLVLAAISLLSRWSACWRSDSSTDRAVEPIISRSEVCEIRSMASR